MRGGNPTDNSEYSREEESFRRTWFHSEETSGASDDVNEVGRASLTVGTTREGTADRPRGRKLKSV